MNTEHLAMPLAMSKPTARLGRIAILWRGDAAARHSATPQTSRFKAIFAALADVGVDAEPGGGRRGRCPRRHSPP